MPYITYPLYIKEIYHISPIHNLGSWMESAGKLWRISVSKGVGGGVSVSDGSLVAHVLDRSSGLCEQKVWLV